jgi:MFS family permease
MAVLPDPGPARTLAVATLVNTIGNGAFITASVLYFVRVVELSPVTIGIGLTTAGIAGLFVGVPAGHLADRVGARQIAALLTALTGVATAAYLFLDSAVAFVAVAIVYALFDRGAYAARQALVARVLQGPALVRNRAYLRAVVNVGVSVGAALAGFAVQIDTREAYTVVLALNAVSFVACALIYLRLPPTPGVPAAEPGAPRFEVLRDRPYTMLTLLNMILLLHVPLLEVVLPLWIVQYTDAPRFLVSALILVNTLSVVLFQVRISKGIDTLGPAVRALRVSGLLLVAACFAFGMSSTGGTVLAVSALVVGAALHVYAEMTQACGAWVVSYDLAPGHAIGQYQGMFNTGTAVAQQLAPALLIFLIIEWGTPGWFVLAGVFLGASFLAAPLVAYAQRTRTSVAENGGVTAPA